MIQVQHCYERSRQFSIPWNNSLAAFDFLTSLPKIDLLIEFYQWRDSPNAMIREFITCLNKK